MSTIAAMYAQTVPSSNRTDQGPTGAIQRALTTLSRGNEVLIRAVDEAGLLGAMCDTIVGAGGYPLAWYGRPLPDAEQSVAVVASAGEATGYLDQISVSWGDNELGQGPTGVCMRTLSTQVRNNLASAAGYSPWRQAAHASGLECSISLPVLVDGELDGALMVYASEPHAFDHQAESLLTDLAADLGFGLFRLREAVALREARADAATRRQQLQATLDAQPDPFILLGAMRDEQGEITGLVVEEANQAAAAFHGISPTEFIGFTITAATPTIWGASPADIMAQVVQRGENFALEGFPLPDSATGTVRRFDITAVAAADGIAMTWRDVTRAFEEKAALADSERRYRLLAENTSDVIMEADDSDRVVWVSDSVTAVLGWQPAEVVGRSGPAFIHEADRAQALAARNRTVRQKTAHVEVRVMCRDGSSKWMSATAKGVVSSERYHSVVALRDIHSEVLAREELAHVLGHDPLTGVAARPVIIDRIEQGLAALAGATAVGVLCVGVDSLRAINDALTHAAGDLLLTTVAVRIARAVGEDAVIGRGTGDEFLVYLPQLAVDAEAGAAADAIRAEVQQSTIVLGRSIEPTVSVGIASGGLGDTAQQLVRDASLAMQQAKLNGRNRCEYANPALAKSAQRRLELVAAIRVGLATGEFVPFFQPIKTLAAPQPIAGYEALVRWLQPDGTVLSPAAFLPTAERSSLMPALDDAVLRLALGALGAGPSGTFMSVNASTATLMQDDYADIVLEALTNAGIPGDRLHLEITETALLEVTDRTLASMRQLAAAGVQWYVDDFGTGYSSISHLRDLPIGGLKLDLSFTAGIRRGDDTSIQLAQALAGLAEGLQLDTVAEGVETEVEAEVLRAQGWHHGQGWLYGRPAPDLRS